MNIDLNKVIVTTNKFEELRQTMNKTYYYTPTGVGSSISPNEVKVMAVYDALDDLLKLLSECVKPYEV